MNAQQQVRTFILRHSHGWLRSKQLFMQPFTTKVVNGKSVKCCRYGKSTVYLDKETKAAVDCHTVLQLANNTSYFSCVTLYIDLETFCEKTLGFRCRAYLLHELGHIYQAVFDTEAANNDSDNVSEEYAHMWAIRYAHEHKMKSVKQDLIDQATEWWICDYESYDRIYKQICCEGYFNAYPF